MMMCIAMAINKTIIKVKHKVKPILIKLTLMRLIIHLQMEIILRKEVIRMMMMNILIMTMTSIIILLVSEDSIAHFGL